MALYPPNSPLPDVIDLQTLSYYTFDLAKKKELFSEGNYDIMYKAGNISFTRRSLPPLPDHVTQAYLSEHYLPFSQYKQLFDPQVYACLDEDGVRSFVKLSPPCSIVEKPNVFWRFRREPTGYEWVVAFMSLLFLISAVIPSLPHWIYTVFELLWMVGFIGLIFIEISQQRTVNRTSYNFLMYFSFLFIGYTSGTDESEGLHLSLTHSHWQVIDIVYIIVLWRAAYTYNYRDRINK